MNPTLRVLVATIAGFAVVLGASLAWPTWPVLVVATLVNTVLGVVIFTPLHEACHGLASRNRRVNELAMLATWPFFLHSPWMFRTIHLKHHAHTGDETEDPDAFTKRRTRAGQWLASFFIVPHYYHRFLVEQPTPRRFAHAALSLAVPITFAVVAARSDYAAPLYAAWIVPNVLATGILAYINTALPHVGLSPESRVGATRILLVPRWAELVMCHQNLHLVHHLRPTLPWYRYQEYWREHEERLVAKGAVVKAYGRRKTQ